MDKSKLLFWEATTDDYWFFFRDFTADGDFVFYGETTKRYGNKGQYYVDELILTKEFVLHENQESIIEMLSILMGFEVNDAVDQAISEGTLKL